MTDANDTIKRSKPKLPTCSHYDNFNKVTLRAAPSQLLEGHIAFGAQYHGQWATAHLTPRELRDYARRLIALSKKLEGKS